MYLISTQFHVNIFDQFNLCILQLDWFMEWESEDPD